MSWYFSSCLTCINRDIDGERTPIRGSFLYLTNITMYVIIILMEELIKALKVLGVENFLEEKNKEATNYYVRGLFECGKEVSESILVIKKYLKH